MSIKWQEPPEDKSGSGRPASRERDAVVSQLKENAGRWALVQPGAKASSAMSGWKKRGCETTSRKREDGLVDIYARWPEPDLAEIDPHIADRRRRGVPAAGATSIRKPLRSVS